MKEKKRPLDFGRWAITGIAAPALTILVIRFVVGPVFFPDVAAPVGSFLGCLFLWYSIFFVCTAAIWKIWHERRERAEET